MTTLYRQARKLLTYYPGFFSGCDNCAHTIQPLRSRVDHLRKPEFPIDIVYSWVDGQDRSHQIKRQLYRSKQKKLHKESAATGRFIDNNELLYSLRSIGEFAPWVNKVFIVTDNQIPKWLNTNNHRIQVIDHSQILPKHALPTFNSHVIEAYLHLIPGLSEQYIYFNDDFFLMRETEKSDFFTSNGIPYVFSDWRESRLKGYVENNNPHTRSFFNTVRLLDLGNLPFLPIIAAHGPHPQSKKNAFRTFEFFNNYIASFTANKFRTNEEVAFYCHAAPLYTLAVHKSIPVDVNYIFLNIKRVDRKNYYTYLLKNKNSPNYPLFACFNDTTTEIGVWQRDLIAFLKHFFTKPSEFEVL
jgi:Protein of unknown function (DUF3184).